ncbi:cellulose-binding domain-containing protein [Streptomyces mangrovisoli]|uniref:Cellulose-binding protein n=1 Tax=Streptomyces mangrovisoli TaxID=1428628 RepID=A0A1J4NLU5_9ACTN|nr:cellulose-binding domain-containing protein [Streptomyces mangrovisoli]OIJ63369.1 cellulose-binding protein [Streptomyces mangrovisoli]
MADLPTPQDATEAELFTEYWDAVLSYADLATAGTAAANQLATEAFTLGMREARAAGSAPSGGPGRRAPRLPMIPLLLTAVRSTAAAWERDGRGHRLDPDLRLWLNSEKAERYTGPPLQRPIALRGLRDLQEADAALLWLAEVEALPLSEVAPRLGLDPQSAVQELDQVRGLFRDRCHRNHLDTPMDAQCRSYARLLDAVTRSSAADAPVDLSRHLATCVQCAEAAACLRLHGGALPGALASGVIGWGGHAYLERRRRAAEVRRGARPGGRGALPGEPKDGAARTRVVRNSLLVAAVVLSGLALAVSMMPYGDSAKDAAVSDIDHRPIADPGASATSAAPVTAESASRVPDGGRATPSPTTTATAGAHKNPDPEPQGTSSATASGDTGPTPEQSEPATCTVDYHLDSQWSTGFQVTMKVTTTRALSDWRVGWSFRDGQQVGQMWDATVAQSGARVTATAADYNKSVAAGGTLAFGFLGTWQGGNSTPTAFTLNGRSCTTG